MSTAVGIGQTKKQYKHWAVLNPDHQFEVFGGIIKNGTTTFTTAIIWAMT